MCGTMVLERPELMNISVAKKVMIIAAVSETGVIGDNGKMPWKLSTDLKRFKEITMGHSVIMGGETMRGIIAYMGKPLPGRQNIVITRHPHSTDWKGYNLTVARSVEEALELAESEEIYICGGAQIYSMFMGHAVEMKITRVHAFPDGDVFFPKWDERRWNLIYQKSVPAGPKDEFATEFQIYRKKY